MNLLKNGGPEISASLRLASPLAPVLLLSKIRCPLSRRGQSFHLLEDAVVRNQYGMGSDGLSRDQQVHLRHHHCLCFEARSGLAHRRDPMRLARNRTASRQGAEADSQGMGDQNR